MASTIKQRLRRFNGTDYDSLYLSANVGDVTGTLAVGNGGTGQTTLASARNAMGLGNTTGALPVANGGTGATTAAQARTNLGITNPIYLGCDNTQHCTTLLYNSGVLTNYNANVNFIAIGAHNYRYLQFRAVGTITTGVDTTLGIIVNGGIAATNISSNGWSLPANTTLSFDLWNAVSVRGPTMDGSKFDGGIVTYYYRNIQCGGLGGFTINSNVTNTVIYIGTKGFNTSSSSWNLYIYAAN